MWNLVIKNSTAKSLQSCPTLCDPRDGSPPGSSIHGIFQVRVLEWVAIAFSTMEYYSAIKKKNEMILAATWLDLEIVILSEVTLKEKDKCHIISLI